VSVTSWRTRVRQSIWRTAAISRVAARNIWRAADVGDGATGGNDLEGGHDLVAGLEEPGHGLDSGGELGKRGGQLRDLVIPNIMVRNRIGRGQEAKG
jgi:hypothetical protein